MNINPSFGRIVKLQGTKSQAQNIASLANSPVVDKTHKAIQEDAKKIFKDATAEQPVRVITRNNGEDVYLLSGKDAVAVSSIISDARESLELTKLFSKDTAKFRQTVKAVNQNTHAAIDRLIAERKAPKTIAVGEYRGEQRIGVVNYKA